MTRVLFTGQGGSGSWIMRGEQLAAVFAHWRAEPGASGRDLEGIDVAVIVKAIDERSLAALKRWGGPIVYDALDFWHQPKDWWQPRSAAQRLHDPAAARTLFASHFQHIAPDLVLCPTRAMLEDLAPLGWPTQVLYHHFDARLGAAPESTNRRTTLLYHGHPAYLREWRWLARAACAAVGARFVTSRLIPPPSAHALLAVRGGRHGCWLARRWKSNVKGATALRLGLPLVAWPEAGLIETVPDAFWFTSARGFVHALRAALRAPRPAPEQERYSITWAARRLEHILESALNGKHVDPDVASTTRRPLDGPGN